MNNDQIIEKAFDKFFPNVRRLKTSKIGGVLADTKKKPNVSLKKGKTILKPHQSAGRTIKILKELCISMLVETGKWDGESDRGENEATMALEVYNKSIELIKLLEEIEYEN